MKTLLLIATTILTIDGALFVVRDSGAAIGVRRSTDTDTTWRVLPSGTQLMGYGDSPPRLAIGYAAGPPTIDGSFLELTTSGAGGPEIGISLNDRTGNGAFGIVSANSSLTFWQLNYLVKLLELQASGTLNLLRPGAGITLTSPDGLVTRTLFLTNAGELKLTQ